MNKVRFEKRGFLYVEIYDIDGKVSEVVEIKNPYNTIPEFVDVKKIRNEYVIKTEEVKDRYSSRRSTKEELI